MSTHNDAVTSSSASEHLLGRVKWFNNKAGYGFITVTDGPRSGSDIFVHHSAINVENQQYKYLVQGEYIEFDLVRTESGSHEWQAALVAGIRGGKLMCETRRESKIARSEYKTTRTQESSSTQVQVPRESTQTQVPRPRQKRVPRGNDAEHKEGDKEGWSLVTGSRSAPQKRRGRPPTKKVNNAST